jgi:hypothetical protein
MRSWLKICLTSTGYCRALVSDARVFKGLVKCYPVFRQNMGAILESAYRRWKTDFVRWLRKKSARA